MGSAKNLLGPFLERSDLWTHWGVEGGHSRIEKKQIVLCNFLSMMLLVMAFPYLLFHALFGSFAVMLIMAGVEVSHAAVLLLNRNRKTILARYFFVFSSNLALYLIILVLGKGIGGHLLFFPFVMFPMLFFGLNHIRGVVFGVACSAGFYMALVLTNFATPFYFSLTAIETNILRYSLLFTAFSMLICGALYWSWLHEKVESELEEASQAKSRFLANMSHELRTPLNAILGYTELLQEEGEEMAFVEVQSDLLRVHTAADKLLDLINDLLDLSKIEANQMELHWELFESGPFLQDLQAVIEPMMQLNDNQFSVEVDPALSTIFADRQKLEQLLLNLLSNAAKFTEQGHVYLRVNQRKQLYCFEVEDTGVGIPPEKLGDLFDAFKQVSSSTRANKRKRKGTGLGLSIARHFSVLMGGDITVKSTLGEGTTFSVCIKRKSIAEDGAS